MAHSTMTGSCARTNQLRGDGGTEDDDDDERDHARVVSTWVPLELVARRPPARPYMPVQGNAVGKIPEIG
jgi:hypothetical protein